MIQTRATQPLYGSYSVFYTKFAVYKIISIEESLFSWAIFDVMRNSNINMLSHQKHIFRVFCLFRNFTSPARFWSCQVQISGTVLYPFSQLMSDFFLNFLLKFLSVIAQTSLLIKRIQCYLTPFWGVSPQILVFVAPRSNIKKIPQKKVDFIQNF